MNRNYQKWIDNNVQHLLTVFGKTSSKQQLKVSLGIRAGLWKLKEPNSSTEPITIHEKLQKYFKQDYKLKCKTHHLPGLFKESRP